MPVVPRLVDEFARRMHPVPRLLRTETLHDVLGLCRRIPPNVLVVPRSMRLVQMIPKPSVLHPFSGFLEMRCEPAPKPVVASCAAVGHIHAKPVRNAKVLRQLLARIDERRHDAVGVIHRLELQPVVKVEIPHVAQEGVVLARVKKRLVNLWVDADVLLGDVLPVVEVLQPAHAIRAPVKRLHVFGDGGHFYKLRTRCALCASA